MIRRFWADESGATAIEYALIVGIMSIVVVSIAATGGALTEVYERIREKVVPALIYRLTIREQEILIERSTGTPNAYQLTGGVSFLVKEIATGARSTAPT